MKLYLFSTVEIDNLGNVFGDMQIVGSQGRKKILVSYTIWPDPQLPNSNTSWDTC